MSHIVPDAWLDGWITWSAAEQRVVDHVRLPRILLSALVGAGLAVSGAALQGAFRNPLVGPQILGISSGAAFGGSFAILFLHPFLPPSVLLLSAACSPSLLFMCLQKVSNAQPCSY